MTEPNDDLAVPYALHAVSAAERDDIEDQLGQGDDDVARLFYDEVRAIREAMAALSTVTALEPPVALRERVLAQAHTDNVRTLPTRPRRRAWLAAAAAAVIVGLGAVGVGVLIRPAPAPQQSAAAQIFNAPDVRTVSGDIPTGGTATVVFSRDRGAGVLVMNNVEPPQTGTVYQMWLLNDKGATSAGTMDAKAVSPSTTAVLPDLGDSSALAFTVEPGSGSTEPTGQVFARLPLI